MHVTSNSAGKTSLEIAPSIMNMIIMQKGSDDNDGDNDNRPSRAVTISKAVKGDVIEENNNEDEDDNDEDDGGNALMSLLDISLDLLSLRGKAVTDDGSGASTMMV